MDYLKNVMTFLALLFYVTFFHASIVSANELTACPGEPRTINWASGGIGDGNQCNISTSGTTYGETDGFAGAKCGFNSVKNEVGSRTVSLHENQTCTVVYTCTPADPVSATLTIVDGPTCCGTYDNTSNIIWEPAIGKCVLPLSVGPPTPLEQTNPLPERSFTVAFSITNGGVQATRVVVNDTGTATTTTGGGPSTVCELLDFEGTALQTTTCTGLNGSITGEAPNAPGAYGYSIRVRKGSQVVTSSPFTVIQIPHTDVVLSQDPAVTIVGEEYIVGWNTTGNPTSCTLTKPDGTTLTTTELEGFITETKNAVGDYSYSMTCTGPGLNDTDSITHRVIPAPIVPTCGSMSQTVVPRLFSTSTGESELVSTNPQSLCWSGAYLNTPSDSINGANYVMSWRWSCEGVDGDTSVVSCSVPNYGCTDPNNINYVPNGPNNKYLCSDQCRFGFNWDVPSQSCVPAPPTTATLSQSSTESAVGAEYRVIWSSTGDNPTTCTIRRSINSGSGFVEDAILWSTTRSGNVPERPSIDGIYRYVLECNGPGGPVSRTINHTVSKLLSVTAPANQTITYPTVSFTATSTIVNGGEGARCKLVAVKGGDDTLGGVSIPCEGTVASASGAYPVTGATVFPAFPQYRIEVTKGSQTAVSPPFTVTIISPATVTLQQSTLASKVGDSYNLTWNTSSNLNSCVLEDSLRPIGGTVFTLRGTTNVNLIGPVTRRPPLGDEGTWRHRIVCTGAHGQTANATVEHVVDPLVSVSTPPDQILIQQVGAPNKTFTVNFNIVNGGGGTTCSLADGNGNKISGTTKACTGTASNITYTILTDNIDYQYRILVEKPSQAVRSGAFMIKLRPPTTLTFTQSSSVTPVNTPFDLTWSATPVVPATTSDLPTACTLAKGIGLGPDTTSSIPLSDTRQETPTISGDYHYTVTCTGIGGTVSASLNHRVNDALNILPIATTTITLPTTAFNVTANISNGGAGTTCRLLDYQGSPLSPTLNCTGTSISLSGNTGASPSNYLYFVEAKNGSQTVTRPFVVTALPRTEVALSHVAQSTIVGEPYTVSWVTAGNPTSCNLTKPNESAQAVNPTGGSISETKSVSGNYTYAISCTGVGGTASDFITHTVTNAPVANSCGSANGTTPLSSETSLSGTPSTLLSLCSNGTYIGNNPSDTVNGSGYTMTWRWSCGTTATTCSAPNYGCTDPNDINYVPNGPANRYQCANQCRAGYTFDALNEICVEVPAPTVTLNQTTESNLLGTTYTLIWSSTGNPTSCTLNITGPSSLSRSVSPSGSIAYNPGGVGTYNNTVTCTNSSGSANDSVSHLVYLALSATTPSNQTVAYSGAESRLFNVSFTIVNGGAGTTCTLLDYLRRPISGVAPFSCTNSNPTFTVDTGLTSFGGSHGYHVLVQKGIQSATSSMFTLTVNPNVTTSLTQSTSTTITNAQYIVSWSSTPTQGAFGAPSSCSVTRQIDVDGDGQGYGPESSISTNFVGEVTEAPLVAGAYRYRMMCTGAGGVSTSQIDHRVDGALVASAPESLTQIFPNTTFIVPVSIQNGGATTRCTLLDFSGNAISAPVLCEGSSANITITTPNNASGGAYGYFVRVEKGIQSRITPPITLTVNPIITATITQSSPSTFTGTPFTISWSSTPASGFGRPTACSITKSIDTGAGFGAPSVWSSNVFASVAPVTETLSVLGNYRYVLSCTGPGGTATSQIDHSVNANDTCGPASGLTPLLSEPDLFGQSGGPAQLCTSGAYANSPADINDPRLQKWVWSCGTASCSAPKYGCTALHNTLYNATGPNNTYGCSATCNYGYNWNSITSTCDPAPQTTATIEQSSSQSLVGTPYTITWSSTGDPGTTCSIRRTQSDGSVLEAWDTATSGSKSETPTGAITHQDFTITCNGPGGTASDSIHHIVDPILSVNTPSGSTITLPNTTFNTTFTVTNGGVGTMCRIVDNTGSPFSDSPAVPCIGSGGTTPYAVTLSYHTPAVPSVFGYGYRVVVSKGSQSATSSLFRVIVTPAPVCGPVNTVPQGNQPSGAQACSVGVSSTTAQTLTTGLQAWNWTCGGTLSCSSPKFGCRTTTDTNFSLPQYGTNGPNNNAGCNGTCANGAPQSEYPACNACTAPFVYDPTDPENVCVAPLSVIATAVPPSTITLPITSFSINYDVTNGDGTSATQCRLVGTDGTNLVPVSGPDGIYSNCGASSSGTLGGNTPSSPLGGAYGYYVQVKKGTQEVISNKITITVNPAPACGDINGIPQLVAPTSTALACDQGAFVPQSQTTTQGSQAWNWTCGGGTSCTAPLYGCRITTDTNYSLPQYGNTGPNNNYGCAATCANGAISASYPACNACANGEFFDPTVSGSSCVVPVAINPIPNQTIQAPNTAFTVSYTLVNGAGATCRLLGTNGGGVYFPLDPEDEGAPCDGTILGNTPDTDAAKLFGGAYGYRVEVTKGTQVIQSNGFIITVVPIAPTATFSNFILRCTNSDGYRVTFDGSTVVRGSFSGTDTGEVTVPHTRFGEYTAVCSRGEILSTPRTLMYSGTLSLVGAPCVIDVGLASCLLPATWVTSGVTTIELIDRNTGEVLPEDGNGITPLTTPANFMVRVHHDGTNFDLRDSGNGNILLDTEHATGICAPGSEWVVNEPGWTNNPINLCLERPVLQAFTIENQFTGSGVLRLVCQRSTHYAIERETSAGSANWGSVYSEETRPYNGTVTYNAGVNQTSDAVNYKAKCINGPLSAGAGGTLPTFIATPVTIQYKKSPPPPTTVLNASPRTLARGTETTLSWTVNYPVATCQLRAMPVCTGACNTAQLAASSTVNAELRTGTTDFDDPNGSRPISSAVITRVGGEEVFPWQARGKKSINVDNSMDFEIRCGPNTNESVKVRVIVTGSNEG